MSMPTDNQRPWFEVPPHWAAELHGLIAQRSFDIHFQPIVDCEAAQVIGYEALARAPTGSALHAPRLLFAVATAADRLVELDRVLVRLAVRRFAELRLRGDLFVNVTADTLAQAVGRIDEIQRDLAVYGVLSSQLVLEMIETRPRWDTTSLQQGVAALRQSGFRLALDDLGGGFPSLLMWINLRPEFVKIDRDFLDGLASDPVKQQFVRSILEMAQHSGCTPVAEGVEAEADLAVLRDMGVRVMQGYLLSRPRAEPSPLLPMHVPSMLARVAQRGVDGQPPQGRDDTGSGELSAGQLARPRDTASADMTCEQAIARFVENTQLLSMAVLGPGGEALGLLRSADVLKSGSERYFLEVFGRRSCLEMMDRHPLVFDASATLREMSEAITGMHERHMVDGFIVTRDGLYAGMGRMSDLIRAISDLQLQTARHANPLTGLPGNLAIERHLEQLLQGAAAFVVVYWDISNFKPFNDVYGYAAGDDLIRVTADVIKRHSDPRWTYVGHIGGDDFVQVLTQLDDWETTLRAVAEHFDHAVRDVLRPEHVAAGGYQAEDRQGRVVQHTLPNLRGGVRWVQPGDFPSARAISTALAAAKKAAKELPGGSTYFLDRRRPQALVG
jgi:diguanylate cyclase (GGDEF)-like protein